MVSFEKWKQCVDDIVFVIIGYHLDDLPDENFRINYDNNLNYCDMAKIILSNFSFNFEN